MVSQTDEREERSVRGALLELKILKPTVRALRMRRSEVREITASILDWINFMSIGKPVGRRSYGSGLYRSDNHYGARNKTFSPCDIVATSAIDLSPAL